MTKQQYALKADALRPKIDVETLEEVYKVYPERHGFLGHKRAKEALKFGLDMQLSGYNVYVMGHDGSGKHSLVREMLGSLSSQKGEADDWCYVNNFEQTSEPFVLQLAAGDSKQFVERMGDLIEELLDTFPAALENPSFQRSHSAIEREFNVKYESALTQVEQKALANNIALFEENGTINFAPIVEGKALDEAGFSQMTEEQREHYYHTINDLEEYLNESLIELPQWKREMSEKQRSLKKRTIEQAIKPLIRNLEHVYHDNIRILKYLREVKKQLPRAVVDILIDHSVLEQRDELEKRKMLQDMFMPNPVVHNEVGAGAPVVYEPNPTYANLFGRIEYASSQGGYYTNYHLIKAGALHKANGGYLIVDAEKLLQQPYVWEHLKLAIKSRQLKMEQPFSDAGAFVAVSLAPQTIPLDMKVIFIGPRHMYYLLQEYDQQFNELFRVLVDFDDDIETDQENLAHFIHLMNDWAQTESLLPVAIDAHVEVIRQSCREAEHQTKLSAQIHKPFELISEAHLIAKFDGADAIHAAHVEKALAAKMMRTGRISEEILQQIHEGTLLIDTHGTAVGRVNGLTVLQVGDSSFGTPSRISVSVYAGSEGVVDIEREVELGQSIHSKGVMLLTGYLGNKYAQDFALAISASIAMEQSYGYIDGDSASLAELCCLISALTGLPITQSLAVTGSINQHGEIQAVGGVNEKIEGFYRICKDRGLSGEQGVIIPKHNCNNLVLQQDVIDAVQQGKFHIYALENVDQALEVLLGHEAGTANKINRYPKDSIHARAIQRLKMFSDLSGADD